VSRADQQIAVAVLLDTHHTHRSKSRSQGCAKLSRETTFFLFSMIYWMTNQPGTQAGTALAL
jgi:hypothetical protein